MKKLRVLALMDESLVPPDSLDGISDEQMLDWKSEYDVVTTLREIGHDVMKLGVSNDLNKIRDALVEWRPHITFNLLEEFHGVAIYDQHVASYLELMKQPYTGCNPRGLMLAHDKELSKQILQFHRIPTPKFSVYARGRTVRPPKRMKYPMFVKSTIEDASFGVSQESLVHDEEELVNRIRYCHLEVQTDALVEEYIQGRELYVGVLGNYRLQVLPVWELLFTNLPKGAPNIATAKVKWDYGIQKQLGVKTQAAKDLPDGVPEKIAHICKRVYRALCLSGYARMDLRMSPEGKLYVLEANPNPNLSYGEDFSESAETIGIPYEELIQRILNLGLRYRPAWRGQR
jgi:D-alanine-D-alanine ligase